MRKTVKFVKAGEADAGPKGRQGDPVQGLWDALNEAMQQATNLEGSFYEKSDNALVLKVKKNIAEAAKLVRQL